MKKILVLFSMLIFLVLFVKFFNASTDDIIDDQKFAAKVSTNALSARAITDQNKILYKKTGPSPKVMKKYDKQINAVVKPKSNAVTPDSFDIDTTFENREYYDAFLKSFDSRNYDEAIEFGENILKIPSRYASKFWCGDVLHGTNIILGKVYLAKGDIKKAKHYLMQSVHKKYTELAKYENFSPVLASFGPDRSLAYDLYKAGHKDIVIKYFEEIKAFWKSGIKMGAIDKAIDNINPNLEENPYPEYDEPDFPFDRWEEINRRKKYIE